MADSIDAEIFRRTRIASFGHRYDREIGIRIHKLSAGLATASEISEATRLIRERADSMMPRVFSRVRRHRAA